jgi:hypothetical protein
VIGTVPLQNELASDRVDARIGVDQALGIMEN